MKKILIALSLILLSFALRAQDARTLFGRIPDAMLPLLSPVNRADFIDFLDSKMKAEVKNKFGGASEMTDLTDSFIRIKLTGRSTWEMKVLPVNDSTNVVCVVSTACGPVCDSAVEFYTSDWKKLPASDYLVLPVTDDCFQLATATLSGEADTLTFTLTTPQYTGECDTPCQPLVYVWERDPLKGRCGFKKVSI